MLIFGVFGIAIITTVTTVTAAGVLLFTLFEALLETELTTGLIEDQRWSIALLLTAGVVSLFHGLVLREDRQIPGTRAATHPLRRVFLVAPDPTELSRELRERPEVERTLWRLAEAATPRDEEGESADRGDDTRADVAERIVAQLDAVESRRALVVVLGADQVLVLPLPDDG